MNTSTSGLAVVDPDNPTSIVPRRPILGVLGLCLGLIGLTLAVLQPQIAEALKPPRGPGMTVEEFADATVDVGGRFTRRVVDRVRGKALPRPAAPAAVPSEEVLSWDWYLDVAGPALGLLATVSGLLGYLRRENLRVVGCAATTGFLAIAWVHIVTALVTALVIVFVAKFSRYLGD